VSGKEKMLELISLETFFREGWTGQRNKMTPRADLTTLCNHNHLQIHSQYDI
jgi:hypothetical protein